MNSKLHPSQSNTLTGMAGYHCTISSESCDQCCGLPLLPLNVKKEGFEGSTDVVEEAVFFFRYSFKQSDHVQHHEKCRASAWIVCRANVLFTNYSIKSSADKLLVYITLFLSSCLKRECCTLLLKLTSCGAMEIIFAINAVVLLLCRVVRQQALQGGGRKAVVHTGA